MKNQSKVRLVGSMLRVALHKAGYTATEVALQVGIQPTTLSSVMNANAKLPVKYANDIADVIPCIGKRNFLKAVEGQYE